MKKGVRGSTCLACKRAHRRPRYVEKMPSVVFYPPIDMPGQPTIEGHRLNAESMAIYVMLDGLEETARDYVLSREELLVTCWWAGEYGPRKLKQWFGEWAESAFAHLWHSCINVADPPVRGR